MSDPGRGPVGFVERYSSWTGRAWLEVDGEGRSSRVAAIGPGYAAARRERAARWPEVPWTADWSDGTFEPAPWGLPAHLVTVGCAAAWAAVIGLAAAWGGGGPAVIAVAAGAWPALRLQDHASLTAAGVRLGPAWAARVPWPDVRRVGLLRQGRRVRLWVLTSTGGGVVDVPPALAGAVRARARRRSGLRVEDGDGGAELRYARWVAAADGVPWGLLVATAAVMPFAASPFAVALWGGLAVAVAGALGAAVHARGSGWGAGAVFWSTVAYGVVLAGVALLAR